MDLHPDLVEQVRAVGMIRLDDCELGSLSSTEDADAGGIGLETTSRVENTGGSRVLTSQKSASGPSSGLSELTEGQNNGSLACEKIEHLFTELAQDLEKTEHVLSEPLEGLEIIENPLPELQIDAKKIEQVLPKLGGGGVNPMFSGVRVYPPVAGPGHRPPCRPSVTAGRPGGAASPRGRASTPPPSPLGRVRRVASSWWGRLRPAA